MKIKSGGFGSTKVDIEYGFEDHKIKNQKTDWLEVLSCIALFILFIGFVVCCVRYMNVVDFISMKGL